MNISIIGSGYVGLVSGTCFAETGNYVTCVDIDKDKVKSLSNGKITIFEPGLEKIFLKNIKEKRLNFTSNLEKAINRSQIIFLALPTPPGKDGHADLRYVLEVADQLGNLIKDYKIIIDKSTVPVGTASKVRNAIAKNCRVDFDVVSNPEFLREGVAVEDFMKPDRIVIGTKSEKAREILKELYSPFVRQGNPIIYMDENSAELTKYAANSFLATKISFMNEIALLCEKLDADVDLVRKGIGTDLRIGKRFLFPGIGYGGSCFPKDVKALIKSAKEVEYDFKILNAVESVNEFQKLYIIDKINKYFKQDINGKRFALWGLSFKPNTDDIREAPSLVIIKNLLNAGACVSVFDPEAINNVKNIFGSKINYSKNIYDCLINADALIIATEWNEFRNPDFNKIKKLLKKKLIFDGRNLFDSKKMKNLDIEYFSIGRK
jgi:UDPglucose 6-dehydrogenase